MRDGLEKRMGTVMVYVIWRPGLSTRVSLDESPWVNAVVMFVQYERQKWRWPSPASRKIY